MYVLGKHKRIPGHLTSRIRNHALIRGYRVPLIWLLVIPNGRAVIAEAVRLTSEQWWAWHWGILLGCSRSGLCHCWNRWLTTVTRMQPGALGLGPWTSSEAFCKKFNSASKHFPAQFYSPYVILNHGFVDLSKNFHFCLKQSKFRKEVFSFSLLLCVWAIVEACRFQCEVLFLAIDDAE